MSCLYPFNTTVNLAINILAMGTRRGPIQESLYDVFAVVSPSQAVVSLSYYCLGFLLCSHSPTTSAIQDDE